MKRKSSIVFFSCLLYFASSQSVFAHAVPTNYSPAENTHNLAAPQEITILFSENLEAAASFASVINQKGKILDSNVSVDNKTLNIHPASLVPGHYTITWKVISKDDGHFTSGSYFFSVGTEPPTIATQTKIETHKDSHTAFFYFVEFFGLAILISSLLIKKSRSNWTRAGALIAIAGQIGLAIALFTEVYSNTPNSLTIILGSRVGGLLFARMICSFVVLIVPHITITLIGTLALIIMRTLASHAAGSQFALISLLVNTIHLTSKTLLLAVTLYLFMSPERTKERLLIPVAVILGGLTGCYVVWLHLKSFNNILSTEWGLSFVFLSIITLGYLVFRTLNSDFRKPKLLEWELITLVIILFLSAKLAATTPPLQADYQLVAKSELDKGVLLVDRQGNLLIPKRAGSNGVVITAQTTDVPTLVMQTKQEKSGTFLDKNQLSVPGKWNISASFRNESSYDTNLTFNIDVPKDINQATPWRRLNLLGSTMLGLSILTLGYGLWLYRLISKSSK